MFIAKKLGFNEYMIHSDYAEILVVRRSGERHSILVEIDDLYYLKSLGYRWCVKYDPKIDGYYAQTNIYTRDEHGKRINNPIKIHNVIMKTKEIIDHIDCRKTLDNRRSNLRVTSNELNMKNRRGRNRNNKSGYRNVSLIEGKYIVQLQIEGKNKCLGRFEDVHEAGAFAKEMRKKYYGDFEGNS
jgi:hypothetical protein